VAREVQQRAGQGNNNTPQSAVLRMFGTLTIFSGSGSDFLQVTVPVTALAPAPYLDHKNHSSQKKVEKNLAFLYCKLFLQGKNLKFLKISCKM
jgi:hypothetical protein